MTDKVTAFLNVARGACSKVLQHPLGPLRLQAMDELKQNNRGVYFGALGLLYDVLPHQVTGEGITEDAPAYEIGKFFVSHSADEFIDAPVIPLATTVEKSFEVGCLTLGLEELLRQECQAGEALPRQCFAIAVQSLERQITRVVSQTRRYEKMSPSELGLKGAEELGEFATAVLVESGAITHKSLNEPSFGEAADVLLCMIAALAKLYPQMSPGALAQELGRWMHIKQAKYDRLLESKNNPVTE